MMRLAFTPVQTLLRLRAALCTSVHQGEFMIFIFILFFQSTVLAAEFGGPETCLKCHPQKMHDAWANSQHAKSYRWIENWGPKQTHMAQAIGLTPKQAQHFDSQCMQCHSTPVPSKKVGVSCQSCHGAAEGTGNWIANHTGYQGHFQQEMKLAKQKGWISPSDSYAMIKKCYSCHIVGDENLVNAKHRGSYLSFDYTSWVHGEVRHNFQTLIYKNDDVPRRWKRHTYGGTYRERKRLLYALDKMIDIEVALSNIGKALSTDEPTAFCYQNIERLNVALEKLAELKIQFGRRFPDQLKETLNIGQNYYQLEHCQFQAQANLHAKAISSLAQEFAQKHDGFNLGRIDIWLQQELQPALGPVY